MRRKEILAVVCLLTAMTVSTGCEDAETGTLRETSSEESSITEAEESSSSTEKATEQTEEENSLIPDDATWLNGNAYYAYTDALSWEDAESYCNDLGGHLISINSADEQSLALELAQSTGKDNAWTGGYLSADDVWTWTDGSSFSYTNWDASQPDCYDGTEFYIRFSSRDISYTETNWIAYEGKWNDTAMEGDSDAPLSSFCFICEWQNGTVDEEANSEVDTHEDNESDASTAFDDLFGEDDGLILSPDGEWSYESGCINFYFCAEYLGDKAIDSYTIHFEMYEDYSGTCAYDTNTNSNEFAITVDNTVEKGEYIAALVYDNYDWDNYDTSMTSTGIYIYASTCEMMWVHEIDLEYSDGTSEIVDSACMVVGALDYKMSTGISSLEKNYPEMYTAVEKLFDGELEEISLE